MVIPLLEPLALSGKTSTTEALLTQRKLAAYLLAHHAHYVVTVKDHQPGLADALRLLVAARGAPDFQEPPSLAHGRIESRAIWTSTRLNEYLDFPGLAQAFLIERQVVVKKTGKTTTETVCGITSHAPSSAAPAAVLAFNRAHWCIENSCHSVLDWNWDADRGTIRRGHGPENITALRRFAIGILKARSPDTVSATIQRLARNNRLVYDYLRLTRNHPTPASTPPGPNRAGGLERIRRGGCARGG